jgi:(4S)-4-hydroxy-5-phosphonooxypentane-2,3-dione isomerase
MRPPTFAIVVTFKVKPDSVAAFLQRVQKLARDSLNLEGGCMQFDVLVGETNQAIIVSYEVYVDAQSFTAHRATPHFTDFNKTVTPWVISKEVRRLKLLEEVRQ